jgi:sec-independent protein translocase protein TatC
VYASLDDDEVSPLEYDPEPVEAGAAVDGVDPVPAPRPLDRRYDEAT